MKPGTLDAICAQFFLEEHTAVILYNQVVIRYDLRDWDNAIADWSRWPKRRSKPNRHDAAYDQIRLFL
jgi:hypothetical protein